MAAEMRASMLEFLRTVDAEKPDAADRGDEWYNCVLDKLADSRPLIDVCCLLLGLAVYVRHYATVRAGGR